MIPLTEYMKDIQVRIDAALDEHLPKKDTAPTRLHEAMRYSIFSGGKRLRPVLCVASAEAVGGNLEHAIMPAIALEALHAYTLIHDDLPAMDNDDIRRGKPTVHKAFDEATAILAGDALLTIAFEWLGASGNALLVHELASATGSLGTIGGQSDDMQSKGKAITKEQLTAIHKRKTAALFAVSCKMGAIAGGGSADHIAALELFGYRLGMAFQLRDDIADHDEVMLAVFSKEDALAQAKEHEAAAYASLESVGRQARLHEIASFAVSSFAL